MVIDRDLFFGGSRNGTTFRFSWPTIAALCAVLLAAGSALAQGSVGVTRISPNVMVFSTPTGNVVASIGTDGALLIGTPSAQSTPEISRAIASLTSSKSRYVVIFPEATDQSQGDAGWGRMGAFVAMQENALGRIGGHAMGPPAPLPARLQGLGVDRPRVSFSEVLCFDLNGEAIHIIHQSPGYSDADAVVHFHVASVAYFGEVFPGDGYPIIDRAQGGTIDGVIKTLGSWTGKNFHIVPARGEVTDGDTVQAFVEMLTTVRQRVQQMIDAGRSEQEVVAARPTAEFDGRWGHGRVAPEAFVREIYESLKAQKTN
jgi:cyclase